VQRSSLATTGEIYLPTKGQTVFTIRPGVSIGFSPSGQLNCRIDTWDHPDGLVLDQSETVLFVAMTRTRGVASAFDEKRRPPKSGFLFDFAPRPLLV